MSIVCLWTGLWIKSRPATTIRSTEATKAAANQTSARRPHLQRRCYQSSFAAVTFTILLVPALLLVRLARPVPYPIKPLSSANGYGELVAIGESLDFYQIWGLSNNQMLLLIPESDDRLQRLRATIRQPFHWPHPYSLHGRYPGPEFGELRGILAQRCKEADHALSAEARPLVASYADHFLFTQIYMSAESYAYRSYTIAEERYALKRLWQLREQMTPSELQTTIADLCLADARPERWQNADRFRYYDRSQKQWRLRLSTILDEWSGIDRYDREAELTLFFRTVLRLVTIDLAITIFRNQHDRFPKSLSELVPEILPAIPADPFAARPLTYLPTDDAYQLYSVGPDRKDNHAELVARYWILANGDITLSEFENNYAAPVPRNLMTER
jgi:hypothetical protein